MYSLAVKLIFVSQSSSVAQIQNVATIIEAEKTTITQQLPTGYSATISASSMSVQGII